MKALNKITNTSITILFFIPFLYVSYIFADSQYGDNSQYSMIYDYAFINNSLVSIYTHQLASINASEPVMAIMIYIFSSLKFSYPYFILVLNLLFIFVLMKFSSIFKPTSMYLPLILMLYFASDFYVLKMFVELHRLKLGIAFLLLVLIVNKNMKVPIFLVGILSHLQILLFFPYFLNKLKQNFFIIFLSFAAIFYFLSGYIIEKFIYYLSRSEFETAFTISLMSLFIFILASTLKLKNKIFILQISSITLFFSLFIGGDRIQFIFFEGVILYLFFQFYSMKKISNKLPLLFTFGVFLISVNLIRINSYITSFMI
jgi:hypothetical protein